MQEGVKMPRWVAAIAPWGVGLLLFCAVAYLFYAPQFEGLSLGQGDIAQYAGMSQDIRQHREATGEDPQWTGNMFSGMPAYLIDVEYPAQDVKGCVGQLVKIVDGPMNMTLFAMILMMVAAVLMGINPWIGIIAGLAYGLSTYLFLIIDAGHITKMWALVYAPPLVASVWYALRRNMWVGALLAALFGSLELGANHPQITYYFLLACLALWLSELYYAFKDRATAVFARRTALLALAALLAVGSNLSPLWYTMRHQQYTTRGVAEAAEVADAERAREERIAYNTAWSYGIAESGNMVVPSYMGSWSGDYNDRVIEVLRSRSAQEAIFGEAIDDLTAILREQMPGLSRRDVEYWLEAGDEELLGEVYYLYEARSNAALAYASNYWGEQPYTAGPTYLGAAVLFLALLGALLTTARNRWWIICTSLFALLLAWGSNIMGFYELMYDLLPAYKNFRTVSMALVIVEWSAPLMAAFALNELIHSKLSAKALSRRIAIAAGVVLLSIAAMLLAADYGLANIYDELGKGLWVEQLREAALEARRSAAWGDALRSTLYIVVTALLVWLWRCRSYKTRGMQSLFVVLIGVVVVADIVGVDRRYLGEDKWFEGKPTELVPTAADREILADKGLAYRVLDLSADPFNSARASYFHRSVGGYHGAKLGRYQEVIDRYLRSNDAELLAALNVRYVIYNDEVLPLAAFVGVEPLGAAWLVEGVRRAKDAAEEIGLLEEVDLSATAVVGEELRLEAECYDATGEIAIVEYAPNYQRYEYSSPTPSLAVFSEIYFADGWTAYIDGEPAPYFAADYLLRGMELPAGEHSIEWRFRAPAWGVLSAIMGICSWLILLGVVAMLGVVIYRRRVEMKQNSKQ